MLPNEILCKEGKKILAGAVIYAANINCFHRTNSLLVDYIDLFIF